MTDYVFIPAITELEMPAPCFGCREIFELNSLWSGSDGEVRCGPCNRERVGEFDAEADGVDTQ